MKYPLQIRALLLCIVLVLALSVLSVRLVHLHVVMDEDSAAEAELMLVDEIPLPARRGSIYSREGELLAKSQRVYTVVADRTHLRNLNNAAAGLAVAEGLSVREIAQKYDEEEIQSRYLSRVVRVLARPLGYHGWELRQKIGDTSRVDIYLGKDVEEHACRELKELVKSEALSGIYFRPEVRRFYTGPRTLTHVIGYINDEGYAEGVEKSMDEVMRGRDGHRVVTRDLLGREIAAHRGDSIDPVDGHSVRLTVDMGLQNIVEAALDEAWYEFRPEKISAVFLDPRTSEVRAMASRPHFDLETREGERRNIAITDVYEPGSTFKIVAYSGAFHHRLISRHTPIFCHQGYFQDGAVELKDHAPYGELPAELALAKSSNIAAYMVSQQLGSRRFHEQMTNLGFGARTGIELSGEAAGVVHPVKRWSATSLSRMCMGYEVSVTPLQMANALAAVANGGLLMKPYVVDAVLDTKGRVIRQTKPAVVRRVMSERSARELRKCFALVTGDQGTAKSVIVDGFKVAGKTSTAQKYDVEAKRYLKGRYVVSFMGFLPAEDPRLLGIIVVDDPQNDPKSRYGGTVAAPVFTRIANEAVAHLDLVPKEADRLASGSFR